MIVSVLVPVSLGSPNAAGSCGVLTNARLSDPMIREFAPPGGADATVRWTRLMLLIYPLM
jgi:hypothetical protein